MHCKKITLKSGQTRWVCVADGPPDPATGKRQQVRRRAKTQKEAKERVRKAIREMEGTVAVLSRPSRRRKMTFDSVATEWIATYALTGVKRATVRIREKEIKILNRYIAKAPIASITHSAYQNILNDLAQKYARTTVQGVNITAGMIFRYALRDNLIKDDPTLGAIVPKKQLTVEEIEAETIEKTFLDTEELNEFLNAVAKYGLDQDVERFYLLAFTGMRSGELCALKWSDVDFEKKSIRITKTLYNEKNNMREYELTPPKTAGSIRTVEVEKEIMNLLKTHRKQQLKIMKYRHELDEYHDGNFVFCRTNGYPFAQKNIADRMRRLLQYTSIKKKATPHIFRHTHISMMTEAGIDLATIMERVGHEDPQTTLKIYTHVTKKMKEDASSKVLNLYGDILKSIEI